MQNYTGVAAASGGAGPIAGFVVDSAGSNIVEWSIPPGVRRLTLLSTGTYIPAGAVIQFGTISGLFTTGSTSSFTSGYYSATSYNGIGSSSTVGLQVPQCDSTYTNSFSMTFCKVNSNPYHQWNFTGQSLLASSIFLVGGCVVLPGALTMLRLISPISMNGLFQLLWEF